MVHLYDAEENCFDGYLYFGLICLLTVIGIYSYLFYIVYQYKYNKHQQTKSVLYRMTVSFKLNLWYWEFILFFRRLIIAMSASLNFIIFTNINKILTSILIIYIVYHGNYKPFMYERLNVLETICLSHFSVTD